MFGSLDGRKTMDLVDPPVNDPSTFIIWTAASPTPCKQKVTKLKSCPIHRQNCTFRHTPSNIDVNGQTG